MDGTRRGFLQRGTALAAAPLAAPGPAGAGVLRIDPTPLFPISPRLHMQFMEPLGVTDGSVEAAWDHDADDWRRDFVDAAADLSPDVVRFGGLLSRYYRWREGVGPPAGRPRMRNHVWGGWESNRVGTAELVSLCRRVGAEPMFCVNFLGDGHAGYARTREGDRTGDAREAADWVAYCNDPDHPERRRHGSAEPYAVRLWQVGNETSYGEGGFGKDEAVARTAEFARAMRARDPSVELIGWGDRAFHRAGAGPELWAADMVERAGEHLAYVAIHTMQQFPTRPDSVLRGQRYQNEPERAWDELLGLSRGIEARLVELEGVLDAKRAATRIAVTEGHLSLPPHNANPVLLEWLVGAYHAVALNTYQRHGRRVGIATAADFNGTRWTVVAVRTQVPRGVSHLTPVGSVTRLFKRHNGREAVAVTSAPADLDVAASATGDTVFLHVANLRYADGVDAAFAVEGRAILGGRVLEIAPDDPRRAVSQDEPDVFAPGERALPAGPRIEWRFPATSVSVVELRLAPGI